MKAGGSHLVQPFGDGVAAGDAVGLPARVAVKVPAPRPTTCTVPLIWLPETVPMKIASVVWLAGAGKVIGTVKFTSLPEIVPFAMDPDPS